MALVAYDYGSESEEGEEDVIEPQINNVNKPTEEIKDNCSDLKEKAHALQTENYKTSEPTLSNEISDEEDDTIQISNETVPKMFENLPQKKVVLPDSIKPDFDDVVEDFIPKAEIKTKQKAKVKISIPSLSDFDNEDEEVPAVKKFKQSNKGTNLLSLLPPVKCVPLSNKSFIPNVLTQKNRTNDSVKKPSKPLIPDSVRKKKEIVAIKKEATKTECTENDSDDSDIEMPETYDEELWQKVCGKKEVKKVIVEDKPVIEQPVINIAPEPVAPYQGLDNEAFKKLVGKRGKMPRNIKLIDINEDELVAEKDLWMTKSITDPECVPKKVVVDESDPTKKKKHHITYLAEKAKANAQELQGQWSASKHNRMQSRAKYGF